MASPHVTVVTEANFEAEVLNSDKLVLIDFYADWCAPCKSMAPALEKFAEENQATVKVVKINVDDSPQLVALFGIQSIPTLVTMKDRRGLLGAVGALPKSDIETLVAESIRQSAIPITHTPTHDKPVHDGPTP